jgi:hypothetical protein
MALPIPSNFLKYLLGISHIYWIKAEVYNKTTGALLWTWEAKVDHKNDTTLITQGQIQLEDNGQGAPSRSASILIYDELGKFLPDANSPVWFGRTCKIYYGIGASATDAPAYALIGTFHVKTARASASKQSRIVTLTCADLSYRVSKARFLTSGTIVATTKVVDQIRTFLSAIGFTTFNFVDSAAMCTGQTYNRSDDRWALCTKLAQSAGLVLYFDVHGIPTLIVQPDSKKQPVSWRYDTTDETTLPLINAQREVSDDQVYNHVLVVAESGAASAFGEAYISDPNDPLYVGPSFADDVPYFIISANGTDAASATARAQAQLAIVSKPFDKVTMNVYPNPYMEYGDIVYVNEPLSGIKGNYVIDTGTLSFDRSTAMTLTMVAQR